MCWLYGWLVVRWPSQGQTPGGSQRRRSYRSKNGDTAIEPEQGMLQNSQFIDAKVHLSAKYGSIQLTRLAEFGVTRQLIGR